MIVTLMSNQFLIPFVNCSAKVEVEVEPRGFYPEKLTWMESEHHVMTLLAPCPANRNKKLKYITVVSVNGFTSIIFFYFEKGVAREGAEGKNLKHTPCCTGLDLTTHLRS